jgi:hypothetical protein
LQGTAGWQIGPKTAASKGFTASIPVSCTIRLPAISTVCFRPNL